MEIEQIVAPGGSLLREDRDEYIAADCDSRWRNAAYHITSLEVYLHACRAVYRVLSRKVGQCVGRIDADIREYNQMDESGAIALTSKSTASSNH